MEHPINLYDIEVAELERDESELPQIVRMAMADFEDEYSHVVERYGIACHPQIVAATAESLQLPYLTLIMEQEPQLAAPLLYGAALLGGEYARNQAKNSAKKAFGNASMLPRETLQLIEKSVFEACAFRAESARGNVDEGLYLPVKSVEIDITEAIANGNCERATAPILSIQNSNDPEIGLI